MARAYTLKEMKGIVEYLKERKAYSEIRGRKMWMDYASTPLTTRTWQSLKETFLKRILPDINNPYYGLSADEKQSFRQGRDVTNVIKNKLEFRAAGETENDDNEDQGDPGTSKNNAEKFESGEDNTCPKISSNRDSVDTVILTTNEDDKAKSKGRAKNRLSSKSSVGSAPGDANDDKSNIPPQDQARRSLRDCIAYTEPLTPMMQEILDDFQTDSDNDCLVICENKGDNAEVTESIPNDKEEDDKADSEELNVNLDVDSIKNSVKKSLQLQQSKDGVDVSNENHNNVSENHSEIPKENTRLNLNRLSNASSNKNGDSLQTSGSQNIVNSTDSTLPNNQEGIENKIEESKKLQTESTSEEAFTKPKSKSIKKNLKLSQKNLKLSLKNLKPSRSPKGRFLKKKTKKRVIVEKEKDELADNNPPKENCEVRILEIEDQDGHETEDKKINSMNADLKATEQTTFKTVEALLELLNHSEDEEINTAEKNAKQNDAHKTNEKEIVSLQPSNPCLQSVSLFEEQLAAGEKSDSSEILGTPPIKSALKNSIRPKRVSNDPVILSTNTDEASDVEILKKKDILKKTKPKREKAKSRLLDSLFSKSDSRKRPKNRRRSMATSHQQVALSSDSSEWSSESDSDFVSPPRSRNRHSKKYMKPQAGRILALEQQGGLFVVDRKKIYPIVRNGKHVKNFTLLHSESDSEEEADSYWKLKYVEERKKNAELTKTLQRQDSSEIRNSIAKQSPILRSKSRPRNEIQVIELPSTSSNSESKKGKEVVPQKDVATEQSENKTVKIKLAQKNKEISLEGQWQNIHHILTDVMQMFQKEDEAQVKPNKIPSKATTSKTFDEASIISIESNEEVHKKVDKLEAEILKMTEERDKIEQKGKEEENDKSKSETSIDKVTTRKKRQQSQNRKSSRSPVTINARPKRARSSVAAADKSDSEIIVNEDKLRPILNHQPTKVRERKSARNVQAEAVSNEKPAAKKTRSSTRSPTKPAVNNTMDSLDDSQTLYKFPSPETEGPQGRASRSRLRTYGPAKENIPIVLIQRLPSPESTQGYRESDDSPVQNTHRKRKKNLAANQKYMKIRRKSYEVTATDDSSNSMPPTAKTTTQNSTTNSEIYRSDSYQLLMIKDPRPVHTLKNIPELSPCSNSMNPVCGGNSFRLSPASQDMENKSNSSNNENGYSSTVSLPLSPELSIVENITVSKNALNNIPEHPTLNESEAAVTECRASPEENFILSQVDVSVPLMEQDCRFRVAYRKNTDNLTAETSSIEDMDIPSNDTLDALNQVTGKTLTQSLLHNIKTVNLDDPTVTDMLQEKLNIKSAKKGRSRVLTNKYKPEDNLAQKKTNKKRCSTPRKKTNALNSQPPSESVIEERMEYCSSGRKSCPPVIHNLPFQSANIVTPTKITQRKPRKQKEIIKVKILRPKRKESYSKSRSTLSLRTDSGINDTTTSILLKDLDESVELIHNHTETCLQANECFNNSVEFVDNSKSVISLDHSSSSHEVDIDALLADISGSNPKGNSLDETKILSPVESPASKKTSPGSINSLITEDLSDEVVAENHGWFLLSDDENSNVPEQNKRRLTNFGASNLKQIFPVTCAIPDLSTITENSQSNSRTPTEVLSPKN